MKWLKALQLLGLRPLLPRYQLLYIYKYKYKYIYSIYINKKKLKKGGFLAIWPFQGFFREIYRNGGKSMICWIS
nr:MAG TPA: hypothetical protein [Caudoviricetes sp.]